MLDDIISHLEDNVRHKARGVVASSDAQFSQARGELAQMYSRVSGSSKNGDMGPNSPVLGKIANAMLDMGEEQLRIKHDLGKIINEEKA